MKFKILVGSALFLGVALGTATPALADSSICKNHEENAYVSHTKGSIYISACAIGRGDGGQTEGLPLGVLSHSG